MGLTSLFVPGCQAFVNGYLYVFKVWEGMVGTMKNLHINLH